jgi:hypothetical protein
MTTDRREDGHDEIHPVERPRAFADSRVPSAIASSAAHSFTVRYAHHIGLYTELLLLS